jgi:hypothetical protein
VSVNKDQSVGIYCCPRPYNTANIITKYQIVYLREKFFELILAVFIETPFNIMMQNIPPL